MAPTSPAFWVFWHDIWAGKPILRRSHRYVWPICAAWLAALAAYGAGNATRARHVSAVRSFFRFLARRHTGTIRLCG